PRRGGRAVELGRPRRADVGAAAGALGRREAARRDRARGDRAAATAARRRTHGKRRSQPGAAAAAAVYRAQQIRNLGGDRHPRRRADGPVRCTPAGAARGPAAHLRLRASMTDSTSNDMTATPRMPGGPLPRFDTPLVPRNSISGRALIAVVAIMTFLASLTTGAVILVARAASEWQSDVAREVTIQIIPVPGRDLDAAVAKAAAAARAFPGIADVRVYSKEESASYSNRGSATGSSSTNCRCRA